jgi:hypothetical protein
MKYVIIAIVLLLTGCAALEETNGVLDLFYGDVEQQVK